MTLREKIYYYRKKCGLSQEELAARVGVSRQAVSKWELGEATPEVEKLLALARTFSITTDQLLSSQPPEEEASEVPSSGPACAERTDGASASREQSRSILPEEELRRYGKLLGGLIRRKGYLAGYILSLYGLGPFFIGLISVIAVGKMSRTASSLMDPGGFFGSPELFNGSPFYTDGGSWASSASRDIFSIPQAFGLLMMLLGIAMIAGGIVLAQVLKRKMARWEMKKNENRD